MRVWIGVFVCAVMLGTPDQAAPKKAPYLRIGTLPFIRNLKQYTLPEYPTASVRANVEGLVVTEMRVDSQGRVEFLNILEAPDRHTARAIRSALSRWVFRPPTYRRAPLAMRSRVFVYFRLKPDGPHIVIPGLTDTTSQGGQ